MDYSEPATGVGPATDGETSMPLFGRRKPLALNEDDLRDLEHSVASIRRRLVDQKMPLNELFALMNEDERPMLAHLPVKRAEDEEGALEAQLAAKPAKPPANGQRSNELNFNPR
jgi:hypothetical protein